LYLLSSQWAFSASAALKMTAANIYDVVDTVQSLFFRFRTEVDASAASELLSRRVLSNPNLEEADLSHKFTIGQMVHLAPSNSRNAVAGNYEVRNLMPPSDYQSEPRYRIKNMAERHERVVTESDLTLLQETANV
jgi:hypothetical protein